VGDSIAQPHPVSHHIYHAAGTPPMLETHEGVCRLCGRDGRGVAFVAWVKPTFTDFDKLKPGDLVCVACQFCTTEATPGLAERAGKDKPQKFRNYSHFVVNGVWYPLSKGAKRDMLALLLQAPDVAILAVSGQKHLFFRSSPGWWQVEEQAAPPFPDALRAALEPITELYHAGISKAEIESGRYSQHRIMAVGLGVWRTHEAALQPIRATLPFTLALFLAQQEEETTDEA
jgi:hypothetical protein